MTIEGFRQLTKAAGVPPQSVVVPTSGASDLKKIEDRMSAADDATQAQLMTEWSETWRHVTGVNHNPDPQAWVDLIERLYNREKGAFTVSSLGCPDADPKTPGKGINPLELALGMGSILLGAAGPAGAVGLAAMTAFSQIFGAGGSEIDWNWVFSQLRTIVREELQDFHIQTLASDVRSLGDWVSIDLKNHPARGSDKLMDRREQAQELCRNLMDTASYTRSTQAIALSHFLVAANLHATILIASAERSGSPADLDVLAEYLENRYVPHVRRVSYWLIAKRMGYIGKAGAPLSYMIHDLVTVKSGASFNLYVHLIRQFMTASMASALDTVDNWVLLADKARQGQLVPNLFATWQPEPKAAPETPVVLYQHVKRSGAEQALGVGHHDIATIKAGIGNDKVSSLTVQEGYRAILYADAGFRGNVRDFTENTDELGGFNDLTSSVVVEKLW